MGDAVDAGNQGSKNKKVFVSYSTKDKKIADKVRKFLKKNDIECWQDFKDMPVGEVILKSLEGAISKVGYVVVVLTASSLGSPWVRDEVRYARKNGICFIPLIGADKSVDVKKIPRYFRKRSCIDLRTKTDWRRLLDHLAEPCKNNIAPEMFNPIPAGFVNRDVEFDKVKKMLMAEDASSVAISAAMVGLGGIGKTWLVNAICNDPDIQDRYDDGILWVTIGEKESPDLVSKVGELIYALTKQHGPSTMEAACTILRELLYKRDILLVVDDVWRAEDLKPFMECGADTVKRLITTRNLEGLDESIQLIPLDVMTEEEAVKVLSSGLPDRYQEEAVIKPLAKLFGCWPLLLSLANGRLRHSSKINLILSQAIEDEKNLLIRNGLVGFDVSKATERDKLASVSLDLSINLLKPVEKELFLDLAIFPEDMDINCHLINRLWRVRKEYDEFESRELLRALDGFSLLRNIDFENNIAKLHDIIRTHLRKLHQDKLAEVQRQFLDSFRVTSQGEFSLEETYSGQTLQGDEQTELPYIWRYAKHHFYEAGRKSEWLTMLGQIGFLAKRTKILGSTSETYADLQEYVNLKQEYVNSKQDDTIASALFWYYGQSAHLLLGCETWQEIGRILLQRLWLELGKDKINEIAQVRDYLPVLLPMQLPPDHPSRENIARQNQEGHAGWISSCLQLADGRYVSTSSDRTVKLWSWTEGSSPEVVATLKGHGGQVTACVELPGNRLVTSSEDRSLILWDLNTLSRKETLYAHTEGVNKCIRLSDNRVVSVSDDKTVRVWNLSNLSSSFTLEEGGHSDKVTACAQLPDGKLLTASRDKTLKVWDLASKKLVDTLAGGHKDVITDCAVLSDGRIISVSEGGFLSFWDGESYTLSHRKKIHKGKIQSCCVVEGKIILTLDDKTCKILDQVTEKIVRTLSGHLGEVYCSAAVAGGRILTGSEDKSLKLWDMKSGKEVITFPGVLGAQDCTVLKGGRMISAWEDGHLDVWSDDGIRLFTLPMHNSWLWGCTELPGNRVATCSTDKTCAIWYLGEDREMSRELFSLEGHTDAVWSCGMLAADSNILLSCSEDGTLRLWDIDTGKELQTIEAHEEGICDCTASNGRPVTCSYDNTLKIWKMDKNTGLPTGKSITLEGHSDEVWCCSSLPDGRIVSGSMDETLIFWSADGTMIRQLKGHRGCVHGCAATPNETTPLLASTSEDGTFKVWDFDPATNLPNPNPVATYYAEGQLNFCFINPDNKRFVVAGGYGSYFLRLLCSEDEIEV